MQTIKIKDLPSNVYLPTRRNKKPLIRVPMTRADARQTDHGYYYTGNVCINGHHSIRYTNGNSAKCLACLRDYKKAYNHRIKRSVVDSALINRDKMIHDGDQLYANRKDFRHTLRILIDDKTIISKIQR